MSDYLEGLNPPQRAAVEQMEGPMIIIAGAGSGKTRVLTYRIAHLLKNGVDSFQILSLTFTNKAAREMKERIGDVVGKSEAKNLWMGTFHSVFARILRSEADKLGYPSSFTIYDSQDTLRLMNSIIKEMGLSKEQYKTKAILGRISQFKNNLITVKAYRNNPELIEADTMAMRPQMGAIYKAYVDRCFKAGAMDFDDLLLRTNELLVRFPDVLSKYQDKFRYVMVDEYQDTNHSQYLIVRALADRFQNICVVGDDSQSIYAFRGANINNILNFQKDYPDVKTFKLEQNYRSTNNIVEAANSLIEKNKTRLDKTIFTANEAGGKIKIMRTLSDGEEGRWVANSIFENAMNLQMTYDDFAILYRTNAQSRAMEDALRKKGIKYKIFGGLSFYQRKEIKDLLAYLRLLINPNDEEALKRVINYPARGIGDTTMDKLTVAANHYGKSIFGIIQDLDQTDIKIQGATKTKLNNFAMLIESLQISSQANNAFEVADEVVKRAGLIKDLQADGTPEAVSRVENVQELLNGIKDFIEERKEEDLDASLTAFLEDVALATSQDTKEDDEPMVSLMTIHLAKGLEFPYVYIVGMEETLFPSAMSINTRSELEEERRLFYVALTRAEKQCYLSFAHTRYRWGKLVDCESSRFLEEIDERYLEHLAPQRNKVVANRFVDKGLFDEDDIPRDKIRFRKPVSRSIRNKEQPTAKSTPFKQPQNLRKLTPKLAEQTSSTTSQDFKIGNKVSHAKFGQGEVVAIEGNGVNVKVEVNFETEGKKKILPKFAKLNILE
ncbi:ATP-dependent helicase [Wenyingzhuangia sp. 2_MG-2023]|uniref:ATP-dependent helicase n=1 Tax=Wenyingzhuangia sp. 2_MG-2023 TaxID=3062639 RepID=UPI0026E38E8F|nr:UvrD-helicase domain-containing protein [Wenyingzhuangia sp. 2_MG-2023]MDO6738075.1 3'-5' exonuclease [Wenyingzhuangia sp. 2_MG-2023]